LEKGRITIPSVATGIIRTIKQDMVNRKLGIMQMADLQAIDGKLRIASILIKTVPFAESTFRLKHSQSKLLEPERNPKSFQTWG